VTDYQCTSVRFIKLSNRIESNRIIFPRIGMLYLGDKASWRNGDAVERHCAANRDYDSWLQHNVLMGGTLAVDPVLVITQTETKVMGIVEVGLGNCWVHLHRVHPSMDRVAVFRF